jgi:endonuclease III
MQTTSLTEGDFEMKNAGKHAEELKGLFKRLLRDGKAPPKEPQDPLQSLVRGAMSYDMPDTRAEEAMRAIQGEFVDLNELRVATELEVQELLGVKYPEIEVRVTMITQSLNNIFEREHTLSLDRLRTVSKRDARQFLRELPGIHPFVEAYVMLMSFDGHAVPIDDLMLQTLRRHEVVDEATPLEDVHRFLEHHLKAEECYDFFYLVRKASQVDGGDEAKKKKAKG